jgi:hypothetical protein
VIVNDHYAEVDEPDISMGTQTKKDDEDEETDRTQLEYLRGQLDPTSTEHFERRKRFDLDVVPSRLEHKQD